MTNTISNNYFIFRTRNNTFFGCKLPYTTVEEANYTFRNTGSRCVFVTETEESADEYLKDMIEVTTENFDSETFLSDIDELLDILGDDTLDQINIVVSEENKSLQSDIAVDNWFICYNRNTDEYFALTENNVWSLDIAKQIFEDETTEVCEGPVENKIVDKVLEALNNGEFGNGY